MRIPLDALDEIKDAYERDCVSVIEIARKYGVSRQGMWKFLRRNGVETRKRIATRRKLECDSCGDEFEVNRARYREQVLRGGTKKHFCGSVC